MRIMSDALFPGMEPTRAKPERSDTAPRYETPNRTQIEFLPCDLEAR